MSIKTIDKFRSHSCKNLRVTKALSANGAVAASATAYMDNGKIVVDITSLSNRTSTAVLKITGFPYGLRIVDAVMIRGDTSQQQILVNNSTVAAKGSMIMFGSAAAGVVGKPMMASYFNTTNCYVAEGGCITAHSCLKAIKGTLVLTVLPDT